MDKIIKYYRGYPICRGREGVFYARGYDIEADDILEVEDAIDAMINSVEVTYEKAR